MNEVEPNLQYDLQTSSEIPQQFIENEDNLFNT